MIILEEITEIHKTLQIIPIRMYIHHQSLKFYMRHVKNNNPLITKVGLDLVAGKHKNIKYCFYFMIRGSSFIIFPLIKLVISSILVIFSITRRGKQHSY